MRILLFLALTISLNTLSSSGNADEKSKVEAETPYQEQVPVLRDNYLKQRFNAIQQVWKSCPEILNILAPYIDVYSSKWDLQGTLDDQPGGVRCEYSEPLDHEYFITANNNVLPGFDFFNRNKRGPLEACLIPEMNCENRQCYCDLENNVTALKKYNKKSFFVGTLLGRIYQYVFKSSVDNILTLKVLRSFGINAHIPSDLLTARHKIYAIEVLKPACVVVAKGSSLAVWDPHIPKEITTMRFSKKNKAFKSVLLAKITSEQFLLTRDDKLSLWCYDIKNKKLFCEKMIKDKGVIRSCAVIDSNTVGIVREMELKTVAQLWDVKMGKSIQTLKTANKISCIRRLNDAQVIASSDYGLRIFDIKSGFELKHLLENNTYTNSVSIIDDSHFVSQSPAGAIIYYQKNAVLEQREAEKQQKQHKKNIENMRALLKKE